MRAQRCNQRYLPEVMLPPALRSGADLPAALRHAAGACCDRHADGLRCGRARAPARRPRRWSGCARGSRRHRRARARDRARAVAQARLRRAVRAEFRARGGARPADGAGGRQRDAALRDARCEAFHGAGPAHLHVDRPIGVEVGGAVKNVLAIATGISDGLARTRGPGPERARRADHARPGRNDAAGARAGRARRDLHGPVRPGRSGADRHRRPVAQPPGRPAAGAGASAGDTWPRWAMWPRACTAPDGVQRARALGVEMPITEAVVASSKAARRRRARWRS